MRVTVKVHGSDVPAEPTERPGVLRMYGLSWLLVHIERIPISGDCLQQHDVLLAASAGLNVR
jgi:hypothetical protein